MPAGQPVAPPASGNGYSWEESATAAMKLKDFDQALDWSVPRLLYRWERYNGMGYRGVGVPSPYLWSYSTLYTSGRFVADHQFNPDAPTRQAGAATMLKQLVKDGTVALPVRGTRPAASTGPAHFPAIMMQAAWALPETTVGMVDAWAVHSSLRRVLGDFC